MKLAIYHEQSEWMKEKREALDRLCKVKDIPLQMDFYHKQEELEKKLSVYDGIVLSEDAVMSLEAGLKRYSCPRIDFVAKHDIISIPVDEIYYVEAAMRSVHIHTRNDKMTIRYSISEAERMLVPHQFIKIHRSFVVNALHVRIMTRTDMILDNGISLVVSRYRYEDVRASYLELSGGMGTAGETQV